MSELVSISRDGAGRAKAALEECVRGGGVALFPADTVYGLGCDPQNAAAVDRVQALKGRDPRKPSAVMFFSPLAMRELLSSLGARTRQAMAALLPGALTLVVANPQRRYPLACGADPQRLGVRLIEGPLAGAALPILQTSANRSGEPAPRSLEQADVKLVRDVDLAIDAGPLPGTPSTVLDLSEIESGGGWRVLRAGAVSDVELEARLRGLGS